MRAVAVTALGCGVPLTAWLVYACRGVTSLPVSHTAPSSQLDHFTVPLSPDEQRLLARALTSSQRVHSQLGASAFYRSPAFAPERVALAMAFRSYDSDDELRSREWNRQQRVSGGFEVVYRDTHSVRLQLGPFVTEFTVYPSELVLATHHLDPRLDRARLDWRMASVVHRAYSRVLLAGAKWKLMRDCAHIDVTRAQ
jgi:hypothetical protein